MRYRSSALDGDQFRLKPSAFTRGAGPELCVFGRLAPGATMASAQAEFATIGRRAATAFPHTHAQLETRVFNSTHSMLDIQDVQLAHIIPRVAMVSLVLVIVALND